MNLAYLHSNQPGLPALLLVLAQWVGVGAVQASADVRGEAITYTSPNGVQERCVMLARMPRRRYRPQLDEAQERALCAIDFYQPMHALCPKLFTTSPGTLVYDLSGGPYARRPAEFEREVCSTGHVVTTEAVGGAISYKMSVNTRETSATFANCVADLLPLRALLRRRGARATVACCAASTSRCTWNAWRGAASRCRPPGRR